MTFLEKLDMMMQDMGISKRKLSQMSKVPYTTIDGFYKKGYQNAKISTIRKIAKALGCSLDYLIDYEENDEKAPPISGEALDSESLRVARLYRLATDHERGLVDMVLRPYESRLPVEEGSDPAENAAIQKTGKDGADAVSGEAGRGTDAATVIPFPKLKPREDGFIEVTLYEDQLPAAGVGTYFDSPASHIEQYPQELIPRGTTFAVPIGGDSMEPKFKNHATAFVKSTPRVEPNEVGLFSLNGEPYIKQLIVDPERREVRLHSFNRRYHDILVGEYDDLRTFGKVLGSYGG